MDEAVAGHATRIEVELERRRPPDRHRQRPRHPGRPAPEIPGQVGARSHHDHAAFGRQVRRQGLRDLRRPARRRRVASSTRCRRASTSRSRATRSSTARRFSARPSQSASSKTVGADAQPPRHHRHASRPTREIFGDDADVQARQRLYKHGPLQGLSLRRRRDPLALRPARCGTDDVPAEAAFQFPGGLADHLARADLADRRCVTRPALRRHVRIATATQGSARMGGRLAAAMPTASYSSYCNTIPTPDGGTHEAGLRAALPRACRAFGELRRQQEGARTSPPTTSSTASAACSASSSATRSSRARPRTASTSRGRAPRRDRGARPFRPLARRQPGRGRAARLRSSSGSRNACAAAPRARSRARPRLARKLRLPGKLTDCSTDDRRRHRALHRRGRQRRRLGQAGARPQDPGDPAAPRQDPQRRLRHRRQDPRQPGNRRPHPGARLRHAATSIDDEDLRYERIIIMTDADVDGAHIATLLMTFFFQEMPELIARAISILAQPPLYRLTHGSKTLYARDDAHRDEQLEERVQGQEGRGQPLQGPRRDEPGAAQGNDDGPGQAHAAQGRAARRRRRRHGRTRSSG